MFKSKYPPPNNPDSEAPAQPDQPKAPVSRAMAKARMKPDFTLFDVPKPSPAPPANQPEAAPSPEASAKIKGRPGQRGQPVEPKSRPGCLGRALRSLFKGLLVALALVWIFILGVLVGRQSFFELPEVHQLADTIEELAQKALNMVVEPRPKPTEPPPPPAAQPVQPAADSGKAASEPEISAAVEVTAGGGASSTLDGAKSVAGTENEPAGPDEAKGLEPPAAAPEPGPKPEAPLVPEPPEEPRELYSVRLLSTSSKTRADELAARLKAQGYEAYYTEASGRYQVRVGRYSNYEDARVVREKLEAQGYDGPYISKSDPGR